MREKIENINDLRAEIERLSLIRSELETDLKVEVAKITTKIKAPLALLSKLNDFFGIGKAKKGEGEDWVSSIFRIGLPLVMNKFVFPKSGFITKAFLALISQNAAKAINKDFMANIIEKINNWINKSRERGKKEPEMADYGIPPDSETY